MNQPRLVKLTIENFKKFSHAVLELDNFTAVNGKAMSAGLLDFSFVLIGFLVILRIFCSSWRFGGQSEVCFQHVRL